MYLFETVAPCFSGHKHTTIVAHKLFLTAFRCFLSTVHHTHRPSNPRILVPSYKQFTPADVLFLFIQSKLVPTPFPRVEVYSAHLAANPARPWQ